MYYSYLFMLLYKYILLVKDANKEDIKCVYITLEYFSIHQADDPIPFVQLE